MTPSHHDRPWISTRIGWLMGLALACNTACLTERSDALAYAWAGEGGQATPPPAAGARELFDAVEADLVETCAGCHESAGAPFLAPPDRYEAIIAWPGILVGDANQSVLLTYPRAGTGHVGVNLDTGGTDKTLESRLREWLEREADERATHHPSTEPFQIALAFNSVELDALGAGLEDVVVTFDARELSPGSLVLSSLELHPAGQSIRIAHPLFAVIDGHGEADPDPVDSLSEVDQRFEAGESGKITPGMVILTNWIPGSRLALAFEVIEPI